MAEGNGLENRQQATVREFESLFLRSFTNIYGFLYQFTEMFTNIPNLLSIFRVTLVPALIVLFYLPHPWCRTTTVIVFIIAVLTDFLDGLIARRWRQVTRMGEFIDPIADKIIVSTALILVTEYFQIFYITLASIIIICREIIISFFRMQMMKIYNSNIKVSNFGKIKTLFQMFSLVILLIKSQNT